MKRVCEAGMWLYRENEMMVRFQLDIWDVMWPPVGLAVLHDDILCQGQFLQVSEHPLECAQANWTRKSDLPVQEKRHFQALAIAESRKGLTSLMGIVEANNREPASRRRKDQFQSDE